MTRDKILPIASKLQRLALVLANQGADPRLCEPHAHAQLRRHLPFEFLGRGVDPMAVSQRWRGVGVGFGFESGFIDVASCVG